VIISFSFFSFFLSLCCVRGNALNAADLAYDEKRNDGLVRFSFSFLVFNILIFNIQFFFLKILAN